MKKFYLDTQDDMFAGVCSGIAKYIGWDVTLVRVLFVISIFLTDGYSFLVYLLLSFLAPEK